MLRGKEEGLFDTFTYMYDIVFMAPILSTSGTSSELLAIVLTLGIWASPAAAQQEQDEDISSDYASPTRPLVALETAALRGSHFMADLEGGGMAQLTLHPALQKSVEDALASHHLPFAAAAVISIPDGRVLVLAGYSKADPSLDAATLALRPWAPAASVFKIVSASALLQAGHIDPETRVCYHAGVSSVLRDNLVDMPGIDHSCASLSYGIGKSQNAIIAKLATRNLHPEQLEHMAKAFGFGQDLGFDAPLEPSEVEIPREPLEFARAAAGFWHSSLSPLHGALLAATIANHGEMPAPRLIEKAVDARGATVALTKFPARRVLDRAVAEQVGRMMQLTTSMGTARHSFRDRRGRPTLPVEVAGKTGTLFYRGRPSDPTLPSAASTLEAGQLGYSWFIGFAPADHPKIAFAVLLGNPAAWPLKAHAVARHLVADYLATEGSAGKHSRLLAHR
jgi:cell division protein FtsI/penicillin-binding protein 2